MLLIYRIIGRAILYFVVPCKIFIGKIKFVNVYWWSKIHFFSAHNFDLYTFVFLCQKTLTLIPLRFVNFENRPVSWILYARLLSAYMWKVFAVKKNHYVKRDKHIYISRALSKYKSEDKIKTRVPSPPRF